MAEPSLTKIQQIITETIQEALFQKEEQEIVKQCFQDQAKLQKEPHAKEETVKPEHMTHLRGNHLVSKEHPRIAFRGAIDSLEAEIILVQTQVKKQNLQKMVQDLEEVIAFIRHLLRCEVTGEPVGQWNLLGLSPKELREHSHHPSQYYGMRHFLPTEKHGEVTSHLNRLRTKAREGELIACRAFGQSEEKTDRSDIIQGMNRLSSLFWVMMIQYLTGRYQTKSQVLVEASGRHVHLSRRDVELLFGSGYQLTKVKELSQPGQYACKERISVTGPKGTLENVVVLGPEREETQVEVSITDGRILGIQVPIRLSGDITGTPGAILSYGDKKVTLSQGVLAAKCHIHVSKTDAEKFQIEDKDQVDIEILGKRPMIFKQVPARVSKDFQTAFHMDYDEANACGYEKGMYGTILSITNQKPAEKRM